MADKYFIVATAGHVDHGKTSIIRALTGTDTDRLPEEKARGITIDLGFAHLSLRAPAPCDDTFRLGIIDVPGHEDFVKNMVAGVGSVDAALFIVAADDGWMPQSEEHLQILTYLGVTCGVVVLTKIDLASSTQTTVDAVRMALRSSPFEDAPIVPTSMVTGEGFDTLRSVLARALADTPLPRDAGKPRLPIDRVFTLRGTGTIVTGTLADGALRRDDAVIVQPSGYTAHIRTMQNHGREVDRGSPGTRIALNLPELDAADDACPGRGQVITLPELGSSTAILDVLLTRLERGVTGVAAGRPKSPANRLIKNGAYVRIHHGSGAWNARVSLLEREPLRMGERAIARLRFETPIFTFAGDRFIVRDGAGRVTLAGGMVLDPLPPPGRLRHAKQRRFLERRAAALPDENPGEAAAAWLERDHAILRSELLRLSPVSAPQVITALTQLVSCGIALLAGDFAVDAAWWRALLGRAAELVDNHHRAHPELPGLPLSQLRDAFQRELPLHGLFETLAFTLVADEKFLRAGTTIRRVSHRPVLPPTLRAAGDRLRARLSAKPYEPPSRKDLAPDALSRQALRFLCDTGEAIEFGDDLVLLEESTRRMKTIILRTIRVTGAATTSELRQVLGTTRRVLIPLLEHLDREGVTRRNGDRRTLK